MFVIKRDNTKEEVSFDKILHRLQKLSDGLSVNVYEVAQKVCSRIHNNVKTYELDEFASQLCSSLMLEHPDYGTLASRLVISNHHKQTSPSFSKLFLHYFIMLILKIIIIQLFLKSFMILL